MEIPIPIPSAIDRSNKKHQIITMLGSRYNDKKERLENRRQSFFLSATDPLNNNHASTNSILYHGNDNSNDGATTASADLTSRAGGLTKTISHNSTTSSTTGLRRHTMVAKTRSLDSGVLRLSNSQTKMSSDNNPQDDYGSTHRETPLLSSAVPLSGKTRARSLLAQPVSRTSCADLTNLDEKPVRSHYVLLVLFVGDSVDGSFLCATFILTHNVFLPLSFNLLLSQTLAASGCGGSD